MMDTQMTSSSLGVSTWRIQAQLTASGKAIFSALRLCCGVLQGARWRRQLAAFALVMLTVPGVVLAQNDAYSVEVAVADRGAEEQEHAYQVAFRRVLLNNSGDKTLLNRDDVRAGLKKAEQYVTGYSYRAPPPGTVIESDTPLTDEVRRTGQATQLMLVSFDRESVDLLIEGEPDNAETAADSETAPLLRTDSALVWLLVQDDGRDIMISDPAAVNVQSRSREIVGAAGISLVFPSGDDEDLAALGLEDLLVGDLDRIRAASARYGQDTILIGTLARNGAQGWTGNWTRLLGDQIQKQDFDTSSLDQALQSGLAILGEEEALDETYRYGGSAIADTEVLVWVGSIDSTANYAAMMKFFEALPEVRTVYPKEVSDTSVVFALLPRSSLPAVESAVVSQSWLRRTAPPVTDVPDSLSRNADLVLEFGR
ncbi:DUF2066 domain-containing protein [Granulosicoccus antarcticus]|nr:DUF2066 domain-containing protein [Granulosicoccus antarcticus]